MRLLTTIALLAATAAAQDPRSATADPFRHAGFLPADTLFVAELRPKAEFQEELEQTRFWGALQEQLDQPGCRDLVAAIRAPLTGKEGDGLRPFDLIARGGTIAVTAPGKDGMPGVLIVVDAGELAARLTIALDDRVALGPKGGIQRRDRSGTPTWQIELGRQPVMLALAGTQLILASSTDRLDATLRCLGGTTDQTLATNARYRHFAKHLATRGGTANLLNTWLDVGGLLTHGLAQAPAMVRETAKRWLGRVGLDGLSGFGMTVGAEHGVVVERVFVDVMGPRSALLAALLPESGQLGLDTATLAPRDVASFFAIETDLKSAYVELLRILDAAEPKLAEELRRGMRAASQQLGIDLEADLIFQLAHRVAAMQWPAAEATSSAEWLYVIDVQRSERVAEVLTRLPMFESSKLGAYDMLLQRTGGVGLAVGRGVIVAASSERQLRRWLGDQRVPTPHPEVRTALSRLSEGGIGCGWVNPRPLMAETLRAIDLAGAVAPGAAMARRIVSQAANTLAPLSWSLYSGQHGYVTRMESSSGFTVELLVATLAGIAEEAVADPTLARLLDASRSSEDLRSVHMTQVLAALQVAQSRHFAEHKRYADLDTLLGSGALPKDYFDGPRGPNVQGLGDSLVTVLMVPGDNSHWVGVVWPADRRTGEVFAVADDQPPMRNELVARSRGIAMPMLRDVFNRGDASAGLTPGWRVIDLGAETATDAPAVAGSGERATLAIIAALEKRGPSAAGEILRYLDSESPPVVSRAVFALGKLRSSQAVPRILEVATKHANVEVRRQAMKALMNLGDRRTVQASMELLADVDGTVRKLAAANLGRLKATEAADALVALIVRASAEPSGDEDAAAALLALGEIGDPAVLLRAAGATPAEGKKTAEALVWMFQTLSPTLGKEDEPKTVMAVLDHRCALLRRFAIQRLGELGDPIAVTALESRLAAEDDQLRPLVEVSLTAIRGGVAGETGGAADFARRAVDWSQTTALEIWNDPRWRTVLVAGFAGLLVMAIGLTIVIKRQRRRQKGESWAAMARQSAGPAPKAPVRLRPRYEDYEPEYRPTENWDAEIKSGEEDDWPVDEEAAPVQEEQWQEPADSTPR